MQQPEEQNPISANEMMLSTTEAVADVKKETQAQDVSEKTEITPAPKIVDEKTVLKKKLKENKVVFYGLPIAVLVSAVVAILFFIVPTVEFYLDYNNKVSTLENNNKTVDESVKNLLSSTANQSTIDTYNNALNQTIPFEPKVGTLITLIQTKANDFNLENQVSLSDGTNKTSVGNIADKDSADKSLFNYINSGEIKFQPKSTSANIEAVLISMEVSVNGDKASFFSFLSELKTVKPVINVVYIDYTEVSDDTGVKVSAIMKLESYAMKNPDFKIDPNDIKQYTKDDPKLYAPLRIENFVWLKEEIDKFITVEVLE